MRRVAVRVPRYVSARCRYQSHDGAVSANAAAAEAFERYTEIDNSNEKRIQALRAIGMDKDDWIGTEKVHGANFGIYSLDHGKGLRFAKRSGIMPPTEHFFGYHVLIPEFQAQVCEIRDYVCQLLKDRIHTVIVNGELFGGKYTHPSVPRSKQTFMLGGRQRGISAVQTDSFPQYSPNLHFYAFDIKYRRTSSAPVEVLTFDEATSIFSRVRRLLYAKPVVRGTLDTVSAFDVETFQTTIPPLLGMGDFPLKGNWAEGLVVRHAKRGTPGWEPSAPTILKFKCVAFQEISTDRKAGPRVDQMESVRKASILKAGVQLPSIEAQFPEAAQQAAVRHLLNHVTKNRLNNVVSKVGTAPFESRELSQAALASRLAEDCLEDFLKESEPALVVRTPVVLRTEMVRHLLLECRRLVWKEWAELVARQTSDASHEHVGPALEPA